MSRDPNGEPPSSRCTASGPSTRPSGRLKAQEQMKAQRRSARARAAAEEEKRLQRAHALEQQRLQQGS